MPWHVSLIFTLLFPFFERSALLLPTLMYAVVFDCESDQLFERGRMPANSGRKSAEEQRREEISRMECTVACAVILYESDVQAVATTRPHSAADERARALLRDSAVRLVCWRDRATLDGDGATVPPFEPLLSAFDGASVIAGYNHLNFGRVHCQATDARISFNMRTSC